MRLLFFFLLIMSGPGLVWAQEKSLDFYVSNALHNSPLLKDYTNQARSNLIDSLRIRASYHPQIAGNSMNYYAPVFNGWGFDNVITNGANISEVVGFSQKLVSRSNLQNQYEAIRLQNEGLEVKGKIGEQDLKKTVTSQYIIVYGLEQQFGYHQEMLDLLEKEESVLKELTGHGIYRQTDYLTFLVTVQQQEILTIQIHLQYQNEFAALNYLSGLVDTSLSSIPPPKLDSVIIPGLEQTVFYHQFEVDSLSLRNGDEQIDFSYKPKVALYADAGYVSSLMYLPYRNFGLSAGVNISVPIYDGHQKRMQHDKIAIAELTREQYRDFYGEQYRQQTAQLIQQLQLTQQLIDRATQQLKFTQGLIEANKKLMETGDAKIADYIIAIGNYLSARNSIVQNTVNKLQIINQLNYWNKK